MYLFLQDYYKQIQGDNLNQILSNNDAVRYSSELATQAEMISYLVQKYSTDLEFTTTAEFSMTVIYKAANRVYLDAPPYSSSSTYAVTDLILQTGNVYRCTTTISVAEPFTISHWTLIGAQYELFFVTYPKPVYDFYLPYTIGEQTFYKDKIYTCAVINCGILPDDPMHGLYYWGIGISYSVSAGTPPTDITKWTMGDNRNQQIILYFIDIALYHLHSRIAPRNIPELRFDRYECAIKWLKSAGNGDVTADLIRKQPTQGSRLRFGSNLKNKNIY